jgi:hypothetical protein
MALPVKFGVEFVLPAVCVVAMGVFWVLLELGAARGGRVDSGELSSSALLRRDASNG